MFDKNFEIVEKTFKLLEERTEENDKKRFIIIELTLLQINYCRKINYLIFLNIL